MKNRKIDEPSLNELIETSKQIALLIEDNTQNIKDCKRVLKQIQKQITPKKDNIITSLLKKIINKSNVK
jgi:hypothetical protein